MTPRQRRERKKFAQAVLRTPGIWSMKQYDRWLFIAEDSRCCPLFNQRKSAIVLFEEIEGCNYQEPQYPLWRNQVVSRP